VRVVRRAVPCTTWTRSSPRWKPGAVPWRSRKGGTPPAGRGSPAEIPRSVAQVEVDFVHQGLAGDKPAEVFKEKLRGLVVVPRCIGAHVRRDEHVLHGPEGIAL